MGRPFYRGEKKQCIPENSVLAQVILLLVIAFTAGAGCLSAATVQDSSSGPLHAHYQYQDSWSPEYGCYSHLTGYVYNAGNASADNTPAGF